MKVSLHAIKAFESAARLGSFKKAAEEMALTPTGVSHHVANLEKRLGVRLFDRHHRQITLTPSGHRLSEATTSGFRTIETALEDIAQGASHLRVESTSSFAALVLIPRLHDFQRRYPDLDVDVSTGETMGSPVSQLCIRLGDTRRVENARVLKTERFGLYGTASVVQAMRDSQPMSVYLTRWKNGRLPSPPWPQWLAQSGLTDEAFAPTYFDQELYGIAEAVAGKGLVFCSQTLVADHINNATLVEVAQSVDSHLCYYTPAPWRAYSLNHQALIEWLKALIN
ncbi:MULTISPECIES: LysR family transcriptional regulator [unclassified Halomonas]|uniref:LysR family transcriptional regulator n=1 Tax=unclassified Halomonas TaxID=2609666 RepID=UPI0021E4835A|nr:MULTISPECIES: LysR family transcriptional regulator [unclassified Halomonas]UYG00857.1 LysR family transcriptional regulator [Halomonas sp. GD1P12]WNL38080.1 LysR family transcriptional regulator [Halomonas sp. PAMB 3232]